MTNRIWRIILSATPLCSVLGRARRDSGGLHARTIFNEGITNPPPVCCSDPARWFPSAEGTPMPETSSSFSPTHRPGPGTRPTLFFLSGKRAAAPRRRLFGGSKRLSCFTRSGILSRPPKPRSRRMHRTCRLRRERPPPYKTGRSVLFCLSIAKYSGRTPKPRGADDVRSF